MNKSNFIFINPNGVLCVTIFFFEKPFLTKIDISPKFDGYDVNGKIINESDWIWIN